MEQSWPDIIRAAASSPLGIVALVILVIGTIGLAFFRNASERARIVVFVLLLGGAAALLFAILREKQSGFPKYVTKDMIITCQTRGDVCAHESVTLGGTFFDHGVIRTQPGATHHGNSYATFGVPSGATRLLFTVGNPYTGDDCLKDSNKKPMLMYVHLDDKPAPVWEAPADAVISGSIPIPNGTEKVKLVGNTGDGPVDCDDSAWANVRFDI